jgi:hypothetical protein
MAQKDAGTHCIIAKIIAHHAKYYATQTFAHLTTFAHFHKFGSIKSFHFTSLLKKKL